MGVEGSIITAKNIILATGAKWLQPESPGADLEEVVNSDDLVVGEKLPKRVLLFGEASWIVQVAQFLRRFGSQVLLATQEKTILPRESRTITSRLRKVLKKEGIGIKTECRVGGATRKSEGLHVELCSKDGPETVVVDRIVTIERGADLKGLGLKEINLDEEMDYLKVNSKMETGVAGVYAIGDLTGPQSKHYAHLASENPSTFRELRRHLYSVHQVLVREHSERIPNPLESTVLLPLRCVKEGPDQPDSGKPTQNSQDASAVRWNDRFSSHL